MSTSIRPSITVLIICSLAYAAGGCASGGGQAKQSSAAVESLRDTKQQLVKAKEQVNQTLTSMNTLSSGTGDLKTSYKQFTKEVAETQSSAADARKRATEMRERGEEYIAAWEKEIKGISSPELRAGAEERRATVRQNYGKIRAAAQATREAYEPFNKDLQDIQAAIAMDLTPAGVAVAKPTFDRAREKGRTLNERIDALIAELDRVSVEMSPAK